MALSKMYGFPGDSRGKAPGSQTCILINSHPVLHILSK